MGTTCIYVLRTKESSRRLQEITFFRDAISYLFICLIGVLGRGQEYFTYTTAVCFMMVGNWVVPTGNPTTLPQDAARPAIYTMGWCSVLIETSVTGIKRGSCTTYLIRLRKLRPGCIENCLVTLLLNWLVMNK